MRFVDASEDYAKLDAYRNSERDHLIKSVCENALHNMVGSNRIELIKNCSKLLGGLPVSPDTIKESLILTLCDTCTHSAVRELLITELTCAEILALESRGYLYSERIGTLYTFGRNEKLEGEMYHSMLKTTLPELNKCIQANSLKREIERNFGCCERFHKWKLIKVDVGTKVHPGFVGIECDTHDTFVNNKIDSRLHEKDYYLQHNLITYIQVLLHYYQKNLNSSSKTYTHYSHL